MIIQSPRTETFDVHSDKSKGNIKVNLLDFIRLKELLDIVTRRQVLDYFFHSHYCCINQSVSLLPWQVSNGVLGTDIAGGLIRLISTRFRVRELISAFLGHAGQLTQISLKKASKLQIDDDDFMTCFSSCAIAHPPVKPSRINLPECYLDKTCGISRQA